MLKDDTDKALGPDVIPMIPTTHRLQWEETQNCHVILYPEGMVKLSTSSAEILKLCDGQRDVKTITEDLQQQYTEADIEKDILNFLEVAHENGWIRTK
jgi:pyrroloquinoline quinone biosynthesis protein D